MSLGLYIHIPFCLSKCHYCDFVSFPGHSNQDVQFYLENVRREIKLRLSESVDTVYIGGGTPSICSPEQLHKLLGTINQQTGIHSDAEITLEVNPGTVDQKKLQEFRSLGINRISIGMQTFNDRLLKLIGRRHSSRQAGESFISARKAGFDNISCDLISGLPNQTLLDFQADLKKMIDLNPDHISIYDLAINENTVLYEQLKSGDIKSLDEDVSVEMLETTPTILGEAGYRQYELSNYAKAGFLSRHNMKYWTDNHYLGVGLSSHSYLAGKRSWNSDRMAEYNKQLTNQQPAIAGEEQLTGIKKIGEFIMLGLRLSQGIKQTTLFEKFGNQWQDAFEGVIEKNAEKGLLVLNGETMSLTRQGRRIANVVFRDFL